MSESSCFGSKGAGPDIAYIVCHRYTLDDVHTSIRVNPEIEVHKARQGTTQGAGPPCPPQSIFKLSSTLLQESKVEAGDIRRSSLKPPNRSGPGCLPPRGQRLNGGQSSWVM